MGNPRFGPDNPIFALSMADLFHEAVPYETIDRILAVVALSPRHTFMVLTKRAERMARYCTDPETPRRIWLKACDIMDPIWALGMQGASWGGDTPWPLRNLWLGVSVEDQQRADERIPHLLAVPAAVRFLSCEPLLGNIALDCVPRPSSWPPVIDDISDGVDPLRHGRGHIDWVICGGESGPKRRPMDLVWARSLRDQCAVAGVAYFMKQIDKVQPIPADLMVREFPT